MIFLSFEKFCSRSSSKTVYAVPPTVSVLWCDIYTERKLKYPLVYLPVRCQCFMLWTYIYSDAARGLFTSLVSRVLTVNTFSSLSARIILLRLFPIKHNATVLEVGHISPLDLLLVGNSMSWSISISGGFTISNSYGCLPSICIITPETWSWGKDLTKGNMVLC